MRFTVGKRDAAVIPRWRIGLVCPVALLSLVRFEVCVSGPAL